MITGGDCDVRVTLMNLVFITTQLAVTQEEFYQDDKITSFTDKMCAYLDIPTDRIRVVGGMRRRMLEEEDPGFTQVNL